MNKQKATLAILAVLLSVKFVFLPWGEWIDENQDATARLSTFDDKQQEVIKNETLILDKLNSHKKSISSFVENLPTIRKGDKANTLWFSLIDTIKTKDIKVYNQRVEYEELITDNVGYVTGIFYMSGSAADIMRTALALEAKAPYVFLEQLKLSRSPGKNKEALVAQVYLRYWFSQINKTVK